LFSLPLLLLSAVALTGCGDFVPPPFQTYAAFHSEVSHNEPHLLVVFTYGYGCFAEGRGNGLRDMAEAVQRRYPSAKVICRGWNDNDGIEYVVQAHHGPVVLIGHSFGGCRSVEITENVQRQVDSLILLDPVPFPDWKRRHDGKYFELSNKVRNAVCFYRPALFWPPSYSIVNLKAAYENRVRDLSHAAFCENVEVRKCVLAACEKEMAQLDISGAVQASIQ